MTAYTSKEDILAASSVVYQYSSSGSPNADPDTWVIGGSSWYIADIQGTGAYRTIQRGSLVSSMSAATSVALTPANEATINALLVKSGDNEAALELQATAIAEEQAKVLALEEDRDKSRVFMRAGAGNTSRYVFQNTVDGTEAGTPLIAEYTAIAVASATASDLELLLTDEASAGKFHLEGNHFAFDYLFAHHYRPHHIISAAGLLYRTREAATLDQLQLDPADTTSGYIQL